MDARAWDARYAAAGRLWPAEPNRWIREATAGLPPRRALDVAAGEGRHARWLAGLGWHVDALDFSPAALRRGAAAADRMGVGHLIRWIEADVVTTVPDPESYDLALVAYLHLPAPQFGAAMHAAAAALRPGGMLVVVGHHLDNLTAGVGGPQDAAVLFTPEAVGDHLASTDLVVERAETVRRPVPDASRDAVDALVTARRPMGPRA